MSRARTQPRQVGAAPRTLPHDALRAIREDAPPKSCDEPVAQRCGGRGEPLVLLHPFALCSEVWRPIMPALRRHHQVFALSIPGHHGSAPLPTDYRHDIACTVDLLERELDALGIQRAHLVGNSLGGWLAIELARRGRALSVVALAPGGGWEPNSAQHRKLVWRFRMTGAMLRLGGPMVLELARYPLWRSVLLRDAVACPERLAPHEAMLLIDRTRCCAIYDAAVRALPGQALPLPFAELPCPVRLVWGSEDRVLPMKGYSERYRRILPGAEWVVLEGVGHVQMYDDPRAVASSILDFTTRAAIDDARLAS